MSYKVYTIADEIIVADAEKEELAEKWSRKGGKERRHHEGRRKIKRLHSRANRHASRSELRQHIRR